MPFHNPVVPSPKKAIRVSSLLSVDQVCFLDGNPEKNVVVEKLLTRLCELKSLENPKFFLGKVLEREMGISTTLGTGLSLPHARVESLKDFVAILGILPGGVSDPKQPDIKVRAVFLFLSPNIPNNRDIFNQHLQLLRSVSLLFQPAFIDELVAAQFPAKALELIQNKEVS